MCSWLLELSQSVYQRLVELSQSVYQTVIWLVNNPRYTLGYTTPWSSEARHQLRAVLMGIVHRGQ